MKDRKFLRTVKGAIRGDRRSFERLMQARGRNILYIAYSIMRDKAAAEDVAQEAAVSMQRNIAQLRQPEYFDSWMYRIVYNACLREQKKMSMSKSAIEIDSEVEEQIIEERDEFLPKEFLDNAEKREELLAVISELPEKHRMCLLLYYYDDMGYKEIGDVLGITVQDVANSLNRSKKKLRRQFLEGEAMLQHGSTLTGSVATKSAGIVGIPLITQIFQMNESQEISTSMLNRFMGSVGNGFGTTAMGSAAGVGSAGTLAAVGSRIKESNAVKVTIAAACALAIGGGASALALLDVEPPAAPEPQQAAPAIEQPEKETPEAEKKVESPQETTAPEGEAPPMVEFEVFEPAEQPDASEQPSVPQAPGSPPSEPSKPEEPTEPPAAPPTEYLHEELWFGGYQYFVYVKDDPQATNLVVTIKRIGDNGVAESVSRSVAREANIPSGVAVADTFDAWHKGANSAMESENTDVYNKETRGAKPLTE